MNKKEFDCVLASDCDPEKQFACSAAPIRGQCISLSLVCDGVEQCLNGRDEANCCSKYCDDGVTCIQDDRYVCHASQLLQYCVVKK